MSISVVYTYFMYAEACVTHADPLLTMAQCWL